MRIQRAVCLLVLFLVPLSAPAKTRRLTMDDVRDKAETVFIGRVMSSSVRPVMNGKAETTDYVVQVSEVLYGAVGHTTTVSFFGSAKFPVEDSVSLEQGREYVFFRTAQPANTTVGWRAGLFTLETALVNNARRTVIISGEGEPLMKINRTLAQGAPVVVRNGEIVARTTASSLPTEPRSTNATPEGNVRILPRRPALSAAATARAGTFATLDDLRAFVRAKQKPSGR